METGKNETKPKNQYATMMKDAMLKPRTKSNMDTENGIMQTNERIRHPLTINPR